MATGMSRGRRVLGLKDSNTIVGVANKTDNCLSKSPQKTAAWALSLSPKFAGQKRKLDESFLGQDDEARQDSSQRSNNSTATELLSVCSGPIDGTEASILDMHMDTSQVQPPPPHSQGELGSDPQDSYFEIHEEVSQRTLDKLHAVSFSQTQDEEPVMLVNPRPLFAKENSQTSTSMSSLIGFDEKENDETVKEGQSNEIDSEQDQAQAQAQDLAQSTNMPLGRTDKVEKEKEKGREKESSRHAAMVAEKALTLRTRLQLAYYKVTTNQASTPFSRLAAQRRRQLLQQQQHDKALLSTRSRLLSPPEFRPAHARGNRDSEHNGDSKSSSDLSSDSPEWQAAVAQERARRIFPNGNDNDSRRVAAMHNGRETPLHLKEAHPDRDADAAREAAAGGQESDCEELDKDHYDNDNDNDSDSSYSRLMDSVNKGEAADLLLQLNRASVTPGPEPGSVQR